VNAQAVAERIETAPTNIEQHPASDTTALIAMIERVALNPDVDIDKMERLLQMQERIMDRNAKAAFIGALADMQPKLPVIGRKGNITIHKKDAEKTDANIIQKTPYALWEDINDAIRPLLAEHGFTLTFRFKKEADRVEVTGILSHRQGHFEETTLSLPMDTSGSKNNVQAIGSSTSYGKRYAAIALLNITTRGEDDDGKAADGPKLITDEQEMQLRDLAESVGANLPAFLKWLKIERLGDLPAAKFTTAVSALEAKRAK
jgi:hypothetical protein